MSGRGALGWWEGREGGGWARPGSWRCTLVHPPPYYIGRGGGCTLVGVRGVLAVYPAVYLPVYLPCIHRWASRLVKA
jgi:hypothetical protein